METPDLRRRVVMFTTRCPKRTTHNTHVVVRAGFALKPIASYLTVLVLSLILVPAVGAQVLYGSLVGNVTDANGAAIPGAKVDITNVATGGVTTTTTDDRGLYSAS